MADSVAVLMAEVRSIVDVTDDEALSALNRRHRRMVARGRSLRKRLEVGPTVAGQPFYAVSGVTEALGISVGGAPYAPARRQDIYAYGQGTLVWEGPGLVVVDASAAGVEGLTLVPAPSDAGASIELFAVVVPADLTAGDTVSALHVDPDYYDVLVDAASATFLRRIGEGNPEAIEARFEGACEELRSRVNRRLRPGPGQIRLQGVNT